MQRRRVRSSSVPRSRSGFGTLEFILVLGVVLPLVAVALPTTRRMLRLVYEMTCTLIAWPFL